MDQDHSAPRICIAVLAAGRARRFGASKLVQPLKGRPLLHYSLEAAQRTCPGRVYLVTGQHADFVSAAGSGLADQELFNPDYAQGIGTSIATAAHACRPFADALIIALADQPMVGTSHLRALINNWNDESSQIVATGFSGTLGPPVLFGRNYFDELSMLGGDHGAKNILRKNSQDVVAVNFEPASIDIDTEADLEALDNC